MIGVYELKSDRSVQVEVIGVYKLKSDKSVQVEK